MTDSEHSPPPRERRPSTKTKKPPPLKKRHTKPCKFYQFGRCTNTAEECNFAHVMVLPGLAVPPTMTMSPVSAGATCKYFAVGQCPSESVCRLRHVPDANGLGAQMSQLHVGSPTALSPTVPAPYSGNFTYPSPYAPYPTYYPPPPWASGSYAEPPTRGPIRNGGYIPNNQGFKPVDADSPSVSLSASTDSSALSRLDTPGDGGPAGALGLTDIGKHGESGVGEGLAINVNPRHDRDDADIITEDPQFPEHAHNRHQSRVRVMDVDPSQAPMGYGYDGNGGAYPFSPPPPWDAGNMQYYSQGTTFGSGDQKVPLTRSSSRASSRSKSAKFYKTKPCKYFSIENGCPNGDSCTFIHDASIPPVPSITRSHSKSPTSPENADDHATHLQRQTDKDDVRVEEDESQAENAGAGDNKEKKKNFFPITWRVIGGGVLMGGKRTEGQGEIGGHDVQVRDSRPMEEPFETRGDGVGAVATERKGSSKFGVAALRQRSRSISNPVARSKIGRIGRGGNDNLFSAESP